MATMKDVAEKAGVSTSTVSHVINDTRYVSPELKEKVEKAMEELGYSPNAVARSLRAQKTNTIGIVVSDLTNPFFAKVVRGVESVADKEDYEVIVANTDESAEKEDQHLKNLLLENKVDGLVIAPTGKNYETFEKLDETVPFVFVDRKLTGIKADTVLSENEDGAYELVSYLIKQGHERIGIVLGRKGVLTSEERFKGYKKAFSDANLQYDKSLVTRGNFRRDGSFNAAKTLVSRSKKPTAIFAVNNETTKGVLQAIKSSDLNWPGEITIGGFDYLECFDFLPATPIITVAQKPCELGIESAKLLCDQIQGVRETVKTVRVGVELLTKSELEMSNDKT